MTETDSAVNVVTGKNVLVQEDLKTSLFLTFAPGSELYIVKVKNPKSPVPGSNCPEQVHQPTSHMTFFLSSRGEVGITSHPSVSHRGSQINAETNLSPFHGMCLGVAMSQLGSSNHRQMLKSCCDKKGFCCFWNYEYKTSFWLGCWSFGSRKCNSISKL